MPLRPPHRCAGEAPDGVAVGDGDGILQQAKALVALAVQQLVLHLLVRELVQALFKTSMRTITSAG